MSSVLAELKRRNGYKVAVAYAVVAWLLIQAASIILPTFEAPAWTEGADRSARHWLSARADFCLGI